MTWHNQCCKWIAHCDLFETMAFFLSFIISFSVLRLHLHSHISFWVTIAPDQTHWVIIYVITLTDTHTHIQRHFLETLWTRVRPLKTHKIHKRIIHATGYIRNCIANKQAESDLRLRPRGQRNWQLWSYLLTPWCRVLPEQLTGLQLVKKFPALRETWKFITALTSFRYLSLSWVSLIKSTYPHPTSWVICTKWNEFLIII